LNLSRWQHTGEFVGKRPLWSSRSPFDAVKLTACNLPDFFVLLDTVGKTARLAGCAEAIRHTCRKDTEDALNIESPCGLTSACCALALAANQAGIVTA
jgi:hypothetical protein